MLEKTDNMALWKKTQTLELDRLVSKLQTHNLYDFREVI